MFPSYNIKMMSPYLNLTILIRNLESIYNNREIKYDMMSLGTPYPGMLLSPFGNLSHTSILYYYNILRIMDICNY